MAARQDRNFDARDGQLAKAFCAAVEGTIKSGGSDAGFITDSLSDDDADRIRGFHRQESLPGSDPSVSVRCARLYVDAIMDPPDEDDSDKGYRLARRLVGVAAANPEDADRLKTILQPWGNPLALFHS